MTHPSDKVYRFSLAKQWSAGRAKGFTQSQSDTGAALVTPGSYRARRLMGTDKTDASALLLRDLTGAVLWLRPDGSLWQQQDSTAFRVSQIPRDLAFDSSRVLWGQSFGWILTTDALVRIDVASGGRHGTFTDPCWEVDGITTDFCDGALVTERKKDSGEIRLRRIRADGKQQKIATNLTSTRPASVARDVRNDHLFIVLHSETEWHIAKQPIQGGTADIETFDICPGPSRAVGLKPDDSLMLATENGRDFFTAGLGHLGPAITPHTIDECKIGIVRDIIWSGDSFVVSTDTGLWYVAADHGTAPAQSAVWISPVLRSPIGEPDGWQRADFHVVLPQSAELIVSAQPYDAVEDALADRSVLLDADPLKSSTQGQHEPSRHFGAGQMVCRHYLGDIESEYLVLRAQIDLPPCAGEARLDRLNVFYPRRSLIDALPAIYRTDKVSAPQLRRSLAGFQALIDEIDDTITAANSRLDPAKTDAVWSEFLLHWLGHGELARLPMPERVKLLQALPEITYLRGTKRGLARVLDILAPNAYHIEDSGTMPDTWLLPARHDPAGARLGSTTRVGHTDPAPLSLGRRTPLGTHVLGLVCRGSPPAICASQVTVRIAGGPRLEDRLRPFVEAIERLFTPAHTRLAFIFTNHRPQAQLGIGAGLDDITLDDNQSRALGQWELPQAGTFASPDRPAVLDHATLNGNLVLE